MAKQYQLPFQLDDPTLLHFDSFINNEWVTAADGSRFEVSDPGTSLPWASCPNNSAIDVPKAVESSHAAFEKFKKINPRIRAQLLMKWDGLIRDARSDLAKILTHETGKPIAEAYGEIDYALGFTWWFAGEAERIQGGISIPSAANRRVFTIKQPIGVAAALIPWNFPIAMALRKAAAAFAAGCTMIIKPSPETPITTLVIAHLALKADFPPGVLNRSALQAPPRQESDVHRLHACWKINCRPLRPGPEKSHPGTGRELPLHRLRRCKPRASPGPAHGSQMAPCRPGLRHGQPHLRPERRVREVQPDAQGKNQRPCRGPWGRSKHQHRPRNHPTQSR
ncbi:succinate-semialdehyde dehydrogenase [Histoplasma capsulatum]|uniref:Succinate-semialdehyde dehydrogenase n=1 Tax=Ajellomyces capsulatus TaxID=5037 RepID=A0A8A1MDU8_AJECA|nr:succinate-semialdehyde dehydrogenase [Histoplasma capsulatum]